MREMYIPGFRSGVLWKKVVASIYYIFILYSCIHSLGMLIFFLATPFAVFSLSTMLKSNQSLLSFNGDAIVFILSVMAMCIGGYSVYRSFFNRHINKGSQPFVVSVDEDFNAILKVHFLGIGQGDCILIQQGHHSILIDAGYRMNGKSIVKYIKNHGIDRFDYIIVTHPHPDHIGGLTDILRAFEVDKLIMPCIEYTRNNYREVMHAIYEKQIDMIYPIPGNCYNFGSGHFEILAPNSREYARLNNYSVVIKLIFGNTSFLFTGDAEKLSEYEMLMARLDVRADVLKIGHHGSSTSSSLQFLRAVSPEHAVLSTGRRSFYGHPDKLTLDNLYSIGTNVYRTDKSGNIIAISDGVDIIFNKVPIPIENNSIMKRLNKRKIITWIKERHRAIF